MAQLGKACDCDANGPGSSLGHATFFGQIQEFVSVVSGSKKNKTVLLHLFEQVYQQKTIIPFLSLKAKNGLNVQCP